MPCSSSTLVEREDVADVVVDDQRLLAVQHADRTDAAPRSMAMLRLGQVRDAAVQEEAPTRSMSRSGECTWRTVSASEAAWRGAARRVLRRRPRQRPAAARSAGPRSSASDDRGRGRRRRCGVEITQSDPCAAIASCSVVPGVRRADVDVVAGDQRSTTSSSAPASSPIAARASPAAAMRARAGCCRPASSTSLRRDRLGDEAERAGVERALARTPRSR